MHQNTSQIDNHSKRKMVIFPSPNPRQKLQMSITHILPAILDNAFGTLSITCLSKCKQTLITMHYASGYCSNLIAVIAVQGIQI